MKENKVNVTVEKGVKTLEILTGDSLPRREKRAIDISGTLDAPLRFYEKRNEQHNALEARLMVSQEDGTLCLVLDEKEHLSHKVSGSLKETEEYKNFGINNPDIEWTPIEFGHFVKMNRSSFEDKSLAMTLVREMMNFKAKVDSTIESKDNNRGSVRALVDQVIETNIPEKIRLKLPIFKGVKPSTFSVEIYINPDPPYKVRLISPDANDIIQETKKTLIDSVVSGIEEINSNVAVIYT